MAARFRNQNQPSFDIFTGEPEPPTATAPEPAAQSVREPLRETFRASRTSNAPHTVVSGDPVNEDLRAQVNRLRYELDTANRQAEVDKLENERRLRDAQSRAEAELKKAQNIEANYKSLASKVESLQRELSEAQTRSTNEKSDLEIRLRKSQEKAQQLQEEADEAKEDLAVASRASEHKINSLQTDFDSVQSQLLDAQADAEDKTNQLQVAQRRLARKEEENEELEAQVIKLKGSAGDSDALRMVRAEMAEHVAHIHTLEKQVREQNESLVKYKQQFKAAELVEEDNIALQAKLKTMDNLREQLSQVEMRRQLLEDEKHQWTSYLESQMSEAGELRFETPEEVARAFVAERLEKLGLVDQLGQVQPELASKAEELKKLEDQISKLQAEITQLKSSPTTTDASDNKIRIRLERQKALATKEADFLRAQLKSYDDEEQEIRPETHDAMKSARIEELDKLLEDYRKEVDELQKALSAPDRSVSTIAGQKRTLENEEDDERIGELRRKNRQLQDEIKELQKRIKVVEAEYKAQHSQLKALKASSRTRVLELKSNPTADAEALKLSTVRSLREANSELLARLNKEQPSASSVPLATLTAAQDELAEATQAIADRDKKMKRLRQMFSAKSLEFREAVASLLGWKLDFMPNGRVRVTSMFYPGDEETGENSIVFDGENGTMKVSGGPQSRFANEIRDQVVFWVEERRDVPCFLAALTMEFYERNTRAAR